MHDFRYRAFISYSHRDSAWADWLQRALETYAIPSRLVGLKTEAGVIPPRLAPIFRDRDELPSATDLSREVNDVLAQSACLIVICSPHAAQSHWVDQEVRAFQRLGRADRIFCVIVAGEPGATAWAGREHDECFPPALRQRLDDSGAPTGERIDPVAADARPHRDGKVNVRLKLIAGILGTDLDDLKHREYRRRRWRAAALAAAVIAMLTLTTALAIAALIARNAAERRQAQAEDLVGYMLGDLDDKLRQVNRLDILESVADKVVKYFNALPTEDMTDDTLAQQARALLKLGIVRFDQGRMPEAEQAFVAAQTTSAELVRRVPKRSDYAVLDAESLTWLGRISWASGDLAAALLRFRKGSDLLDHPDRSMADSVEVMDQSAVLHTNIGRVLEARGDLDGARKEYVLVLRTYERLSAREPDKLNWKTEVAYAHNNLGQLAWTEGHLDEAIREYAADRDTKLSLLAFDPSNNSRREDLLISNAILGKSLLAVGETELAARYLQMALVDAEKLVVLDPTVTSWQEDAGYYGQILASLARMQGDLSAATRVGDASLVRLRDLVSKDSGNVTWVRELADGELEAAQRSLAKQRTDEARILAKTALDQIETLFNGNPANLAIGRTYVQALIVLGDIAAATNNAGLAHREWQSAKSVAEKLAATSRDPSWLDLRAVVDLRLQDSTGATPLVEQLARMGYQFPDYVTTVEEHGAAVPQDRQALERIATVVAALGGAKSDSGSTLPTGTSE